VPSCSMPLTPAQRREAQHIADELAAIARTGQVLPGSISERRTRCGRSGCNCMADPPRPHGPYYQWTRKVAAKTVGRWLSVDQADEYRGFIDNHRKIKELVGRLEALGLATLDADQRTRRTP